MRHANIVRVFEKAGHHVEEREGEYIVRANGNFAQWLKHPPHSAVKDCDNVAVIYVGKGEPNVSSVTSEHSQINRAIAHLESFSYTRELPNGFHTVLCMAQAEGLALAYSCEVNNLKTGEVISVKDGNDVAFLRSQPDAGLLNDFLLDGKGAPKPPRPLRQHDIELRPTTAPPQVLEIASTYGEVKEVRAFRARNVKKVVTVGWAVEVKGGVVLVVEPNFPSADYYCVIVVMWPPTTEKTIADAVLGVFGRTFIDVGCQFYNVDKRSK